jgi:hypothetical protein
LGWHEREARWKRRDTIDNLELVDGSDGLGLAREAVESDNAATRHRGITALGRVDLNDVAAELVALTRNAREEENRRIATMTIARSKDRTFSDRLIEGAGDGDRSVGNQAYARLKKVAEPADIADLLEAADRIEMERRVDSDERARRLRHLAARLGKRGQRASRWTFEIGTLPRPGSMCSSASS